ncbi:hypothetical protein [Streptomyces virginiae]|uniref:hypothetical protein n=1 Tax=Streptomyces virginiae TaxID=1961 RepID=UPI00342015C2
MRLTPRMRSQSSWRCRRHLVLDADQVAGQRKAVMPAKAAESNGSRSTMSNRRPVCLAVLIPAASDLLLPLWEDIKTATADEELQLF